MRKMVLASPAENMLPPTRLSFMKMERIGAISPNPLNTKMSDMISSFKVLFIFSFYYIKEGNI